MDNGHKIIHRSEDARHHAAVLACKIETAMVSFAMARMTSDPCKTFGGHNESRFVGEVVFGLRLPDVGPAPSQGMCCYSSYVISAKQHIDLAPIKGRTDALLG